jgi:hypothetical protein
MSLNALIYTDHHAQGEVGRGLADHRAEYHLRIERIADRRRLHHLTAGYEASR